MTKENILKNIYTIEALAHEHNTDYKLNEKIKKLIEDLKRDVLLEENKELSGGKKRINTVLKMLEKASKIKPVLNYCTYDIEGYQTFTDCYIACFLTENDKMPIETVPEKMSYPSLRSIFEMALKSTKYKAVFKTKVNKILSYKKICNNRIVCFYNPNNDFKTYLDIDKVITIINCLDLKNNDDFILYNYYFNINEYYQTRFSSLKNKNDSLALILPIRVEEEEKIEVLESEEF